mgnify:CR=1 FL=1
MKNGYKRGVSIVEVGFFTSDTCFKEKNGNLSLSRNMIVDADVVENPEFRREQLLQFNDYIASKIYEAWGPITDETGCAVEILPFVELKGDSKTTKLSVTLTATVFKDKRKEVANVVTQY